MTAILGRNGAGKTTLLRSIVSLITPTEGRITVDEHDTRTQAGWVRRHVGYLPQEFAPFPELTVREFLGYIAALAGGRAANDIDRLIALTHLERYAGTRASRLSGGTRRRLGVAQALIGRPALLVVDEPTAGLDPEERVRLRQLLAELATTTTVLLSTHLVEDVAALVDRVLVLDEGALVFDGSSRDLAARAAYRVREVISATPTFADAEYIVSRAMPEGRAFRLRLVGPEGSTVGTPVEPTLEDGYLSLVRATSRGVQ
ncbi:MAG TPA: ATP-binding cassette domain-containing protein [Candidatus Limnocylindria bacterium]|nr:ATP-binding cassette domain-containing protein [Candidatus Limnocylindria bacterium]